MADLDPLIRYRKHQLDEKQKFLARLYTEADKLLDARMAVLDQIEKEKDVLWQGDLDSFVATQGFGHFLFRAKNVIEEIQRQEGLLDTRIQIAIDDMRESFGELKKVEITQRNRLAVERKKLQAKEDALFEEVGINIYLGKNT